MSKGIILAGGEGTRLYPVTSSISKQLLPVYDKPMIFYPISILMLAGIKDILIITTPRDLDQYKNLLGDGSNYGLNLQYETQIRPAGIADAFLVGKNFIGNSKVSLILGDNIFWGQGLTEILNRAGEREHGATLFGYKVKDPGRFGIAEINEEKEVISLEEKPADPKSDIAVTGLYLYDNEVIDIAKTLKPSARGELEITDLNRIYLEENKLYLEILGRGFAWLDTGTHASLLEASTFVETIEKRQGLKIACLEEIAIRKKWLSSEQVLKRIRSIKVNEYFNYIKDLIENEKI